MTGRQDTPASRPERARLLLEDLALIAGTLSEISTVWRRSRPYLPGLPLRLPARLQDAARQLTSDVQGLVDAGPLQVRAQALAAAARLSALKQGIASAQAMTQGPGLPDVGDRKLWASLSAALGRAETRLTALGPLLVAASG